MIQDFKIISSQVNDLSQSIKIELTKQGQHVNRLEANATAINKNAKNVKKETNETNDINEENTRKGIFVVLGLVVIVSILLAILRLLY